jgi:hypothetical protein
MPNAELLSNDLIIFSHTLATCPSCEMVHICKLCRSNSFPSLLTPRDCLTLGIDLGVSHITHCQLIPPQLVRYDGEGDHFRSPTLLHPLSIDRVRLVR